jgi:hypothetical protein
MVSVSSGAYATRLKRIQSLAKGTMGQRTENKKARSFDKPLLASVILRIIEYLFSQSLSQGILHIGVHYLPVVQSDINGDSAGKYTSTTFITGFCD